MDFESPDDIETRFRRQTPVKTYTTSRQEEPDYSIQETPQRPVEEVNTASGSESDYYENNAENADSLESDSSASEEGSARTPANSLYMMEKNSKKKLIVKDGRVIGRAKAQRKDKGKTRITAYMMWAKEARNELLKKHPDMDFSAISKRLGEMWSNVNYNERYLWKRKAKRFAIQKEQNNQVINKIISNPSVRPANPGPGRPSVGRPPRTPAAAPPAPPQLAITASSSCSTAALYRVTGCAPVDVAAHLRLLGESLAIIGARLKEHEGQIAVSGSVSVLLDTLVCALGPLAALTRALPGVAPPPALLQDTLHNIAYIMPGLLRYRPMFPCTFASMM